MKYPKVVITAGPTREYLDPVRFLSNPSTGKMGFALAAAAVKQGYYTVLVTGPVALKTPVGVHRVDVVSAREMLSAVRAELVGEPEALFIATAAVADWRPRRCARVKLKKQEMAGVLELVRNPDILKSIKGVRKIGFAAETGNPVAEAVRKCRAKRLLFTVANDVTAAGCGFGTDTNRATLVFPDGRVKTLPMMTKRALAKWILEEVIGGKQ